ncbi:MAG: 3-deoxy-8-phosphooctulonate synthase [Bacteroidales bacterium]
MTTNHKNIQLKDFIPGIEVSQNNNFFLMAGPCVVESRELVMNTAEQIVKTARKLDIPVVFKASYRKANRSRIDSFTGIGDEKALKILAEVHSDFNVPVITDIHSAEEAEMASVYVDVLQIPAFLCRQTDILVAAASTGRTVSIKKGQFLSPASMQFAIDKVRESGNNKVIITERGTMFGYQDLVVDFRGIPAMRSFRVPVVLDITHSLQEPNHVSGITGGRPEMIETIALAGIATGVDGIFVETHPEPGSAKSDGANMLPLSQLEELLTKLVQVRQTILGFQTLR